MRMVIAQVSFVELLLSVYLNTNSGGRASHGVPESE